MKSIESVLRSVVLSAVLAGAVNEFTIKDICARELTKSICMFSTAYLVFSEEISRYMGKY